MTAIKTGAVWIITEVIENYSYHWLLTSDFALVVNSNNYGHKYIEPFQRYAYSTYG